YILLGMIIEAATGKTYEENLQERIFEPLELEDTFLVNGQPEPSLLPQGYVQTPFDYTTGEWNLSQGWSAGAVVSKAEDMAVFLKTLFSGELFQDPATLDLMLAPSAPGFWSEDYYYGHGMFYKNGLLGHGGQALGYQSDVGYFPDEDVTIVIWGNSAENGLGSAAVDVAQAIGLIEIEE
ncbi:MAG: serine hydrolase domain-containing protein, partial [Chloroflexota bacterium]